MSDDYLTNQAVQLERMLPKLMRRLFTLDPDHPASELPLAQLRVGMILQHGPRTLSAVSEELGISVSATTQIADRMERAGLVERVVGAEDRRTRYLQLSPVGRETMTSRHEMRVSRVREALNLLSPEKRILVIESIQSLLHAGIRIAPEIPDTDQVTARQEQA